MPEYVELFAAALVNRQQALRQIVFGSATLGHQDVVAFANMLRANAHIEHLFLYACDIDSAGCQALFEALNGNTHLRTLSLISNRISAVSLSAVRALGNSNLRRLDLDDNPLTDESVLTLAEGLRTNFTLEELHVDGDIGLLSEAFGDLLTSFNFTLRTLHINNSTLPAIDELLRVNEHVRNAHNNLLRVNYHVEHLSLWPRVLDRISSKPFLLYQFVRLGNLDMFANHVVHAGIVQGRRRERSIGGTNNSSIEAAGPRPNRARVSEEEQPRNG
jgi:hypothetical protein